TDDVLIRLSESFRVDEAGEYDEEIYRVNLALAEAMIRRETVAIEAVDESRLNVDLDKNGTLNIATEVVYDWAPLEGREMAWVGRARTEQLAGEQPMSAGLLPYQTEFLHTVRYIETGNDDIRLSPRLKELRYARKTGWRNYGQLEAQVAAEEKEKHDFPDRLRTLWGDMEYGLSNNQGWIYQGFIEDAVGDLRPQTYEETVFCMGCHGGMGATTDGVFAFPRKLDSDTFQSGWYHWTQKSIEGQPEPKRADGNYEYTHYLTHNGAGDEFRANTEVMERFFNADGSLKQEKVTELHNDISVLLYPSVERARQLNKAYRLIVMDQDFVEGRDAIITPPQNVHTSVEDGEPTGVEEIIEGPQYRP
ncbi:MAG: hypothetical protein KDJ38_17595, partial [Gammaproteobacteria bacterium]|nr:hypothetical protein [Gammaproteobacteria bacterium]